MKSTTRLKNYILDQNIPQKLYTRNKFITEVTQILFLLYHSSFLPLSLISLSLWGSGLLLTRLLIFFLLLSLWSLSFRLFCPLICLFLLCLHFHLCFSLLCCLLRVSLQPLLQQHLFWLLHPQRSSPQLALPM